MDDIVALKKKYLEESNKVFSQVGYIQDIGVGGGWTANVFPKACLFGAGFLSVSTNCFEHGGFCPSSSVN